MKDSELMDKRKKQQFNHSKVIRIQSQFKVFFQQNDLQAISLHLRAHLQTGLCTCAMRVCNKDLHPPKTLEPLNFNSMMETMTI